MSSNTIVSLIVMVVLFAILAPFAVIWSVNTLFNFGIEYDFWNWVAASILMGAFGRTTVSTNKGN